MSQLGRFPGTLLTTALVAASLACGHRGDPLPPLRHTPPGLAEFRLAQRGDALEVTLLTPSAYLLFVVTDGTLALLTLALLVRQPQRPPASTR